jgi:hypothetical protein
MKLELLVVQGAWLGFGQVCTLYTEYYPQGQRMHRAGGNVPHIIDQCWRH